MPTDDLDARIRSVVADAVAAAPPPPDLGTEVSGRVAPVVALGAGRSRRWLAPAVAGLTAVAAVVGLVLVVNRGADTAVAPGTDVTEPSAPQAVTTTVAPGSTVTTVVVTTVPDAVTTTQSPDTAPPDTTTLSVVPDVSTAVVTAGSDGVWVVDPDGTRVQWWAQPAAFAVQAPDGSILVQQHLGNGGPCCQADGGWEPSATLPLRLVGPNSYPVFLSADLPGGWYRLHDVAQMPDGRMVALVEWQTTVDEGLSTQAGRLYAVDLQTGAAVVVCDAFGGWEEGSSRLHLAETGVIVGEYSAGITRSFYSAVIPGGLPLDTRPILPEQLGLEAGYDDCADCPQLFAIDRSGSMVAWIDGDDLVVARVGDQPAQRRVSLGGRGAGAIDIDIAVVGGQAGDGPLVVAIEYGWEAAPNSIVIAVSADDSIAEWPIGTAERVSL